MPADVRGQMTALDPAAEGRQLDLFDSVDEKQMRLNQVMEAVNQRYGEWTLCRSGLLGRSSMPNVYRRGNPTSIGRRLIQ